MKNIKPEDITHYHIFNTHFRPLSYSDLNSVAIKKEKELNFSFQGLMTKDISEDSSNFKPIERNLTINFREEFQIFSLINGGWLPLPFVNPPNFLVDSNVVINLEKTMNKLSTSNSQFAWWWLQLLNSEEVVINPILYAFEGKESKTPKLSEFIDCYEDSIKTIQNVLPRAGFVFHNNKTYTDIYKIINNSIDKREKQIEFLHKVNPLLLNHISKRDLLMVESEILSIAKHLKINLMSLIVLLTLSCLYESNEGVSYQVARKILKFSPSFNEAKAFNSLSDLAAIEIFAGSGAVSNVNKSPAFAFCTSDKAIALFCCAINLRRAQVGNNGLTFNISVTKELFPVLNINEVQELVNRLSSI